MRSANPDVNDVNLGMDLVQTYAEVVKTTQVLQKTVDALGISLSPDDLRQNLDVTPIAGTAILSLTVTNEDAQAASDIVNELAHQLILNSPTNLTDEQQQQGALLQDQVNQLTVQIADDQQRLVDISSSLAAAKTAAEIADLNAQRDVVISQMDDARATLAQFTATLASLQVRRNSVEIIEQAQGPGSPLPKNMVATVLLAAISAASLAIGGVLAFEYLDDRIKSIEDVERLISLPSLAVIRLYHKRSQSGSNLLTYQILPPDVEESYHWLSARLTSGISPTSADEVQKFVITSPWAEDGKSTTAANLAIMMALTGKHVLLFDADLRRPRLHQLFNLANEYGLTNLLNGKVENGSEDDWFTETRLTTSIQHTGIPNLDVITSGPVVDMSPKLLDAHLNQQWLNCLTQRLAPDVILFDTPPCLVVNDACSLAARTNSSAILVVHAGRARISSVKRAKEVLMQFSVKIEGVVLNKASIRETARYRY